MDLLPWKTSNSEKALWPLTEFQFVKTVKSSSFISILTKQAMRRLFPMTLFHMFQMQLLSYILEIALKEKRLLKHL